MAEVVWTRRSLADLAAIRDYIGQFNPAAAQRMALRLRAAGESLADQPDRGRPVGTDRRELATVPPYLIRYRVRGGGVELLTIRHSARNRGA